jgi:ABC-type taurine transport system substrate-binding protein
MTIIPADSEIKAQDSYINDPSIDACVVWAPFIYDITDPHNSSYIPGSELLLSTAKGTPAYGTIAEVCIARKDFIQENPEIIKAFTRAMIDGYRIFMGDRKRYVSQMAEFFREDYNISIILRFAGERKIRTFSILTMNFQHTKLSLIR